MKATHSHRIATPSQRITYQFLNEAGEEVTKVVVMVDVHDTTIKGHVWVIGTHYSGDHEPSMETVKMIDPAAITKREQQYQDSRYGTVSYRVVS